MSNDFTKIYGAGRPLVIREVKSTGLEGEYTLEQFKRQASRFGPEQVYETARTMLPLKDLIELVHALRELPTGTTGQFRNKKDWSLTKEQREELAERMSDAGYKDKAITRVTKG